MRWTLPISGGEIRLCINGLLRRSLMEKVVEQGFWGAVLKGLVKKVAKSVELLRENEAILGGEGCGCAR